MNFNKSPADPVLCAGTPHEMGVAQGTTLGAEIRGAYEALRDIEAFCLRRPRWLPFGPFRRLASSRAQRSTSPAVAVACRSLHERVAGIADGAGVGINVIWLLQAMEGVLGSVDGLADLTPPGGCSAVAIRGAASVTGSPVIAHNFDYLPVVQAFYAVRESRPSSGFRSLEFTAAPLAGAVDGVNEKGLAVTYNYAQTLASLDPGRPGPTISMRISEVLGAAATVREAIEMLSARSRWGAGLLMLADATGDMASLELSNTQTAVRFPEARRDLLFHANKFMSPATIAVEVPVSAMYHTGAPRPLRGHRVLDSSLRRMARFEELATAGSMFTTDGLAQLMSDHGGGPPSDSTLCMHGDYWVTTACVQCLPRERAIRVSFGAACSANYRDYAL